MGVEMLNLLIFFLLSISMVLSIQMLIGYIKSRIDREQRTLKSFVKEYVFKIIVLLLFVLFLYLINKV